MLTWYRGQSPERQALAGVVVAGAVVALIVLGALLDLPVWFALGVALVGIVVQLVLRRARPMM